ncbi:carbamoyltransferase HypF [Methyloglobulus sp.]|uniref:carbamoyltransferase HypF n=1 Tax=Methyloglobulus sp. TaxID=2518622 RepID=UPI0032B760FC
MKGFVQGVGFRPFVARLAQKHLQKGWIANTPDGVNIAIEGHPEQQQQFLDNLGNHLPPFAEIKSQSVTHQPLAGFSDFQIMPSIVDGKQSTFVLPDIATCQDCICDILDPNSRYYHYPFTSCCHCGPRYSIMLRQPYDRTHTSMAAFKPCTDCGQEYESIDNRRFHSQTIACPNCGPELRFLDASGNVLGEKHAALMVAVQQLRAGKIVAIKGIGGYQLLVDASNKEAIERLRQRKHRPQKPFALMVADLPAAQSLCFINEQEQLALLSPAAPIVLLKRRDNLAQLIDNAVAPDSNLLGIMLAYSPLHHLLLREFGSPLIATSGNRQNEPICIDEQQALMRLSGTCDPSAVIADYFLTHNRPILRPLDDSIVRLINSKITVLRRARGYTPLPITSKTTLPNTLALGGQLKNTVAICHDQQIILSQHLGDLDSEAAQQQFLATLTELQQFYQITPTRIMHDIHKGYVSSQLADNLNGSKQPVQHHYAHALSCMAEHGLEPPVLGIVWDGAGLGDDNTLWGGEFLLITEQGFQRYAHFRSFSLPGGVKAIQEPRRAALGLLYEIFGDSAFNRPDLPFTAQELNLLQPALNKQINCPRTSSAGRLFDAVASILGLCQINQYEGQAAIMLENNAAPVLSDQHYLFQLSHGIPIVIDWEITIKQILDDIAQNTSTGVIAANYTNTLAEIVLAITELSGQKNIVLSGGCFQNALLVEKAVGKLKTAGFNVYCHERIPPNDGGLALGQLYATKYMG